MKQDNYVRHRRESDLKRRKILTGTALTLISVGIYIFLKLMLREPDTAALLVVLLVCLWLSFVLYLFLTDDKDTGYTILQSKQRETVHVAEWVASEILYHCHSSGFEYQTQLFVVETVKDYVSDYAVSALHDSLRDVFLDTGYNRRYKVGARYQCFAILLDAELRARRWVDTSFLSEAVDYALSVLQDPAMDFHRFLFFYKQKSDAVDRIISDSEMSPVPYSEIPLEDHVFLNDEICHMVRRY